MSRSRVPDGRRRPQVERHGPGRAGDEGEDMPDFSLELNEDQLRSRSGSTTSPSR